MLTLPGVQLDLKDGLGRGLEEIARFISNLFNDHHDLFRGYPETLQAIKAVKQERAPFQRSISEAPRQMNEKQNTGAHEI